MSAEREERLRGCVEPLLGWYRENRRPLPWRAEPAPYRVWVSEIMLQQTRIEAVIPYYERFLAELPDAAALAAVSEERLLKLWEGLGYYSRARNLKGAAERIVADFGGELPADAAALRSLPGIGDYTAGAIASIAFGLPEPAVDGNVLRVVMRLTACGDDVLEQKTRRRVAQELRAVYPTGEDAGKLTEALMELGETVCVPNGEARCALCPLRSRCLACERGEVGRYPQRSPKKERRREEKTVLLLRCGDRWALRRRGDAGLLAGLWELPNLGGRLDAAELRERLRAQGLLVGEIKPCGEAKHVFTHVEWHMSGFLAECEAEGGGYEWKRAEEIRRDCALPTAFKAYAKLLE